MLEIAKTAREYIGTPYQHQGRLKGVGIDCVGLLICVGKDCGYLPTSFDYNGYPRQADGFLLMDRLHQHLKPIKKIDMEPGDVVVVKFDQHPQHVGIVGDYRHGGLSIIHAASVHGEVIETRLLFTKAMQFVAAYRYPGA